jgi:hypothetical protein
VVQRVVDSRSHRGGGGTTPPFTGDFVSPQMYDGCLASARRLRASVDGVHDTMSKMSREASILDIGLQLPEGGDSGHFTVNQAGTLIDAQSLL